MSRETLTGDTYCILCDRTECICTPEMLKVREELGEAVRKVLNPFIGKERLSEENLARWKLAVQKVMDDMRDAGSAPSIRADVWVNPYNPDQLHVEFYRDVVDVVFVLDTPKKQEG